MADEQRKAVERLAKLAAEAVLDGDDKTVIRTADLRTLLALVREPVASVEGRVYEVDGDCVHVEVSGQPGPRFFWTNDWPGAVEDQPLRIDVHAVDVGEEK